MPDIAVVDKDETASNSNENDDRLISNGDSGARGSVDLAWTSVTAPTPELSDENSTVSIHRIEEYPGEYTDGAPSFPCMSSTFSPGGTDRIHESYLSGIGAVSDLVPIYRDCWSSSEAVRPLENGRKMTLGEKTIC